MRILFYFRTHFDDTSNKGVIDKCNGIIQGFTANRIPGEAYFFSENGLEKTGDEIPVLNWPNKKRSIRHLWLYYIKADRWLLQNINFQQYTHFFIRHLPANPGFIHLLREVKRRNPAIKILLELPTWPYDDEVTGWPSRIVALIDRYYRKQLRHYVDVVLHYGTATSILGIPVINISNGIRWQDIPMRHPTIPKTQTLRLIAVGNWNKWHGLDRIIQGIYAYYRDGAAYHIQLQVVGNGPDIDRLRELTTQLHLHHHIHFHPPCSGTALGELFDQADIAVGVVGLHRKGLKVAAPLKHRDYCARGIPFIMAGQDLDFPVGWPLMFQVPVDDSIIFMEQILHFWQSLPVDHVFQMRKYAEQHLGWESKLKPVLTSHLHMVPPHPAI